MTHQEKINFITKKAHEANPSILDLVLGCKVLAVDTKYVTSPRPDEDVPLEDLSWDKDEEEEIIINEGVTHIFSNIAKPGDFFNEMKINGSSYLIIEILGREIRLADVLLAIGKGSSANNYTAWLDDECFETPHFLLSTREELKNDDDSPLLDWNLLKDSLTDQSTETVDFIYQLLQ